ncbi:glutathione S-transferase family protein [Paracoccus sanguinis]|uniref:glutathione S-transferase family protein n=1 Tax=Paracoccus sanguinis TaxID=1545044 RepID=UPI00051F8AF4|nr:glutathione S-transferase family protein [Paracoccus sanguinis]KGJ14513.1 glutathionyl-hydroquinone reductase YqjG [Paracoccus sanguinis]
MNQLVDGKWVYGSVGAAEGEGAYRRQDAGFRNWITPDGRPGPTGEGGFAAEAGRYHLYVSYACPWAHRTLIFRALKGLEDLIGLSVVHPLMGRDGWSFATDFPGATGDPLLGAAHLRDIYLRARPDMTGKATVPILWDKARGTIVSNESSEIIRMFDSAFDGLTGSTLTFCPEALSDRVAEVNARVYDNFNNGVYKAGFASTQEAYDAAVGPVFETMAWADEVLSRQRYLAGDRLTEADWRMFTSAVRFDNVYHTHFRCNRAWLRDYPNLWGWTRELYQIPGVAGTVRHDHIVNHYYRSHPDLNKYGIIPINPVIDWDAPHGRDAIGGGGDDAL